MSAWTYDPVETRRRRDRERKTWFDNSFGSRTPEIVDDPDWQGFSVPEWMLINTTDEKKRYK